MSKKFNFGRDAAHIILFLISMAFSLQFAYGLGNNLYMEVVLCSFFGALEFAKLYSSKKVKADSRDKKIISLIIWAVVLLAVVALSAMASFAATRASIMSQSSAVTVSMDRSELEGLTISGLEYRLNEIDKSIEEINASTDAIQAEKQKMMNEDGVWIRTTERFETILEDNRNKKEELLNRRDVILAQIEALNKLEGVEDVVASEDIFKIMAEDFNTTDTFMLKMIMLSLIILLELFLFLTATPLGEGEVEVKKDEKELFSEYVNELFNNTGKYLLSDNKISSHTGISLSQCKKYREFLTNIKMRGNRPLIEKEANGWTSQFPCSTVEKVAVKNLFMDDKEV